MTEIDGEYLMTDEASVAVMFLDKPVAAKFDMAPPHPGVQWETDVVLQFIYGNRFMVDDDEVDEVWIPRALVREAIEPVEGEPAVWGIESWDEPDGLVLLSADEAADLIFKDETKYNWRLVNICQDYDELRKLVEWARG